MINKNRFRIQNTKKVLHKIGKRWVVVSAVLLGLLAGGAAITTANADTTQVAQPQAAAQANHETAAEKTAANSTVAQPAHTARLGAEFGASNPLDNDVNNAKSKVHSKVEAVKDRIQQDSGYANVTNLTKLANTVRGNASAKNAYQNLGSLATSASDYTSLSLGNTSVSTSNTVFSMFSQASNDFNTISNAQSTSNGKHYLSKITSLFSEASSFANDTSLGEKSGQSSNVSFMSQISLPLSSNINVTNNNGSNAELSLNVSVNPTLSFNSEVGLNVPRIINSGLNISNVVSNFASTFASENTASIPSIISQAQTSADETSLPSQVIAFLSSNQTTINNKANNLGKKYFQFKSQHPTLVNKVLTLPSNQLSTALSAAEILNQITPAEATFAKNINGLNSQIKNNLGHVTTSSEAINDVKSIYQNAETSTGADDIINDQISAKAPTMYSTTISSVANNAANFAGSLFATSGDSLSNYQVGPFVGYNLSSVTSYINKVNGNLSSANSEFASASNATSASKSSYMNSLGLPEALESIISGFISITSNYANKASNYVSNVTKGLDGFFSSKSTTKPAYNNLINAVAALPNDLQPTSNASSSSTEEAKLYNDYYNIASNTNDIDSAAMNHTAAYSNGSRIKRYVSDAARDATNSIVNEASSSANSMFNETSSFNSAVTDVNKAINSIESNDSASYTNYAKALNRAKTDSSAISAESSAYANSLTNSSVNNSNARQFANDADGIKLDAKVPNKPVKPAKSKASSATSSKAASIASEAASKAAANANNNNMPFIPSFNGGSSMVSANTSVSASAEPSMASSNSFSAESKARYANYVLVTKALQLHTRANFTKKNGIAVIKPGMVLNVEKTVRARHGLVRYEVRYNNKNYFVTANKHFGIYDSYELAKPSHYRYAKVDIALQLHQSTNFTKKNGIKVVKPGMEFRINRVVKSNRGSTRYEVSYKGSVYFITANAHYVENAYLQKSNFKRGRKAVRVIKPLNEYRRAGFTKRNLVRHFRRGIKLHVSRVCTIAKGEVTRLQLTNGRYVTANKDFVRAIR